MKRTPSARTISARFPFRNCEKKNAANSLNCQPTISWYPATRRSSLARAASLRLTPTAMVFHPPLQEKRYRQRSSSTMWSFSMTIFRLDSANAATAAMRKSTTGRSTSLRCAASREPLSTPASFARCRTAGRAFCRRVRAKNERVRSSCCTKLFRTAMRNCARTRWLWPERTGVPMQTASASATT